MSSPKAKTSNLRGAPLDPATLERLRAVVANHGAQHVASAAGLSMNAIRQATAGFAIHAGTRVLLERAMLDQSAFIADGERPRVRA